MEQTNFKVGDCVQLKHGGGNIKMTINYLEPYGSLIRASCKWFNEKTDKFENEVIYVDALKPCSESNEQK
jgi:uncharacterized protein YodC (DUF2158 family)